MNTSVENTKLLSAYYGYVIAAVGDYYSPLEAEKYIRPELLTGEDAIEKLNKSGRSFAVHVIKPEMDETPKVAITYWVEQDNLQTRLLRPESGNGSYNTMLLTSLKNAIAVIREVRRGIIDYRKQPNQSCFSGLPVSASEEEHWMLMSDGAINFATTKYGIKDAPLIAQLYEEHEKKLQQDGEEPSFDYHWMHKSRIFSQINPSPGSPGVWANPVRPSQPAYTTDPAGAPVVHNVTAQSGDPHASEQDEKDSDAINVKAILNRTAVPGPLAPAAVGPSSSVSTNVSTSATTATHAGVGSVALPSTEKPSLTPVRDPATDNRADHSTEPVANQATSLTQGSPDKSVNRGLNPVNSSNLDSTQPRSDAASVVPTFTALPGSHQASESALLDKIESLIHEITRGIEDRWYFKTGAEEKKQAIVKSFDALKQVGFSFNNYTSLQEMQNDAGEHSELIKRFIDALQMSRGFFETNKDDVNSFKKFKQEFNDIIETPESQDLTLNVNEAKKSRP